MRLSIKEAADRLDVSEVTVRRRLRNGELNGEQEETPQGFRWVVLLPDAVEDDNAGDQFASSATDQPTIQTVDHELLTELRGQVGYFKQEIEDRKREHDRDRTDWRDELQRLHTLMAQQGQTVLALTQSVEQLPEPQPAVEPGSGATIAHTYLSQLLPTLIIIGGSTVVGLASLIWKLSRGVDWSSTLDLAAIASGVLALAVGGFTAYRVQQRTTNAFEERVESMLNLGSSQDPQRELEKLDQQAAQGGREKIMAMVLSVVSTTVVVIFMSVGSDRSLDDFARVIRQIFGAE